MSAGNDDVLSKEENKSFQITLLDAQPGPGIRNHITVDGDVSWPLLSVLELEIIA